MNFTYIYILSDVLNPSQNRTFTNPGSVSVNLASSSTEIVLGNDLSKNSNILPVIIAAYCLGSLTLT